MDFKKGTGNEFGRTKIRRFKTIKKIIKTNSLPYDFKEYAAFY